MKRLLLLIAALSMTVVHGYGQNAANNCYTVINGVGVYYPCNSLTQGINGVKLSTAVAALTPPPPGLLKIYANVDDTWHQLTSAGVDTGIGGGGGGTGTVTTISAPASIFSIANPTTTPALSYATSQTANQTFGTSGAGAVGFQAAAFASQYTVPAPVPIASLPTTHPTNMVARVTDGTSITDCTVGGGGIAHACQWNGSAWLFYSIGNMALGGGPASAAITASNTTYAMPFGNAVSATEIFRQWVSPNACQVKALYVNTGATQSGTGSLVITVRVNGAPSAVTLTIASSAPAGVFSDTAHTQNIVAGDLISFSLLNNASAASVVNNIVLSCLY